MFGRGFCPHAVIFYEFHNRPIWKYKGFVYVCTPAGAWVFISVTPARPSPSPERESFRETADVNNSKFKSRLSDTKRLRKAFVGTGGPAMKRRWRRREREMALFSATMAHLCADDETAATASVCIKLTAPCKWGK